MNESTSSGATPSSADPSSTAPPTLRVGVVLFPGFEALDVYGPVEMWGNVPELTITTMAEAAGPVPSSQGPSTVAEVSFAEAPQFDILMVPGGFGTRREMENGVLLEFLRRQHGGARLTTSVCTGSVLLAAAGILDGRRATSNKLYFHEARKMGDGVHWIERARWVDDGDLITSSGVTAGMDMALHVVAKLYGRPRAEQLATWVEYEWNDDPDRDPFVADRGGAPSGAP